MRFWHWYQLFAGRRGDEVRGDAGCGGRGRPREAAGGRGDRYSDSLCEMNMAVKPGFMGFTAFSIVCDESADLSLWLLFSERSHTDAEHSFLNYPEFPLLPECVRLPGQDPAYDTVETILLILLA